MARHSLRFKNDERAEGAWRDVMTRYDRLDPDPGRTWNIVAYTYYGQVETYDILTNEDAPDFTILLLKDSYSAPIRHVIGVDLRRSEQPVEQWIEEYRPDAAVMAYSLQMLRDDEYQFN